MAYELTLHGEKKVSQGETLQLKQKDTISFPIQFIYELLILRKNLTPDMIDKLENSSRWCDEILLLIIYVLLSNGKTSSLLKYDIIIADVKSHKLWGVYTTDSWMNDKPQILLEFLDENGTKRYEYSFPPRANSGVVLVKPENENFAENCIGIMHGVSIRKDLWAILRKGKRGQLGGAIKKMIDSLGDVEPNVKSEFLNRSLEDELDDLDLEL